MADRVLQRGPSNSMGGAVVVHVANRRMLPKVRGVIVVDVVEGRAHTHLSTEAINTEAGRAQR